MATRGVTGPRRPLGGLGDFGSLAFSIPLGFRTGRPLSPFNRAISVRWAATVCSRAATLPSNRTTSPFSSVGESASRSPGGAILSENQRSARQGSEKRAAATSFAAGTSTNANVLEHLWNRRFCAGELRPCRVDFRLLRPKQPATAGADNAPRTHGPSQHIRWVRPTRDRRRAEEGLDVAG